MRGLVPVGDDALGAHHRHVDPGQRRDQPRVALVLHHAERAGVGHREVDAAHADLGGGEVLAQAPARVGDQRLAVVGQVLAALGAEELGDLGAVQMHGGGDDVRRSLTGELQDPLAEVGLHDPYAGLLEGLVELDLLRGHRLRLGDEPGAARAGEVDDVPRGRVAIRRVEDGAAGRAHALLKLRQELREPPDVVGADLARAVAHLVEPELVAHPFTARGKAASRGIEVRAQLRVVHGGRGALPQRRPVVIGDVAAHPPSRSATCRARIGTPTRRPRPTMCIRHDRSQATSSSAPEAAALRAFCSPRAPETSGNVIGERAPEPAADVGVGHLDQLDAGRADHGPRAVALPEQPQHVAGVVVGHDWPARRGRRWGSRPSRRMNWVSSYVRPAKAFAAASSGCPANSSG